MSFPSLEREDEAPVFVQDPSDGKYKVKNKHTGELEPAWKYLHLEAGDEFGCYVRRSGYCEEFPYDPNNEKQVKHNTLWPQRKLRILFFAARDPDGTVARDQGVPEVWSPARVLSWTEMSRKPSGDHGNASMKWALMVEFEATGLQFQLGDVVKLKGLKNQQKLNGRKGLVSDSHLNKEGRCRVILMDFNTQKPKVIAVKPTNLERVLSMEFDVHRIEIRRGGVLMLTPPSSFSPKPMLVTFHWAQDLLQKGPYWSTSSPGKKWLEPFSADDFVDEFRSQYQSEMEACLQHDTEEEKTRMLIRVKDELKSSLQVLTRNGSPIGMREARLLLFTKPLVISLAAINELVLEAAHNLHILDVIAWMYQKEDFRLCEATKLTREQEELFSKLGLDCDSAEKLLSLQLSLYLGVLIAFLDQKEFRKALMHAQSATGEGFLDKMNINAAEPSVDYIGQVNKTVAAAWLVESKCAAALGLITQLIDIPSFRDTELDYDHWVGTSGKPATEGVSWTEDKYDAEAMAWTGAERNCAVCRQPCLVTYWCSGCGEVPYCSTVCSNINWEQNGHWRECARKDGKYVGLCAVCGKRSVIGCSYCKFTYYCDSVCQRKHWFEGGHQKACPKVPMSVPSDS